MDNLTHSLVAITLARTRLQQAGKGTTATLLLASNAPDIDIVTAFVGGTGAYLAAHRGPSHGPLGILALGIACALIVRAWRSLGPGASRSNGADDSRLIRLMALGIFGAVLHVLMDLPTSYGTRLLSPFVTTWFAWDWLPIIDIYLWIALIAGLIALALTPDARRRVLGTLLFVILANYGLRATAHHLALERAGRIVGDSTFALERWPGEPDPGKLVPCVAQLSMTGSARRGTHTYMQAGEECGGPVAIPRFLSPFQWLIVQRVPDGYELTDIDLVRPSRAPPAAQIATRPDTWTKAALNGRVSRIFMEFTRLPSAVTHSDERGALVRFQDVRFIRRLDRDEGAAQPAGPFVALIRLDPQGSIVTERLGE